MSVFGIDLSDPSSIGYPVLVGGVLLGSIIPVVPTGAVVSAAAAVSTTTAGGLSLPVVVLLSVAAALVGDLVTFGIAALGSRAAVRLLARGMSPDQLEGAAQRFARRGGVIVVIGRLVPAGRIPSLLAAAALGYPWRRLVPAATVGCVLWAIAYALLGVVSGGLFDDPVLASLVAALLVLVLAAAGALWQRRRGARPSTSRGERRT